MFASGSGRFAQYISLLGSVEDDIVGCFRKGGGVPYERFPRFHAVMAEDSGQSVLSSLESHILPLVTGLTDRLARGIRVLVSDAVRAVSWSGWPSCSRTAPSSGWICPERRSRPPATRRRSGGCETPSSWRAI
jgi:hypothetical protein